MTGARVKPLVWRGKNGCFRGDSADGTCYAANEISPARWMLDRHGIGASVVIGNDFPTLAKAAAAAQADYSARILSAIDTTAMDAERDELRALVEEMRANRQEIAAEVKQLACLVQETLRLSEEKRRLREARQAEAAAEIASLTEERDRLQDANMWRSINTAPETGEFLVGVWVGSRWSHWVASGGEDLGNDGEFGDPPTHWRPSPPLAEPPPR